MIVRASAKVILIVLCVTLCRQVASNTNDCAVNLRKITPYLQRKAILNSIIKEPHNPSKFEVVYSDFPVAQNASTQTSSKADIKRELSSIDLKAIYKKDFLVYLDMDDTLLEQWAPFFVKGYHTLTIREDDAVDWHIALTPALENLIHTIRSLNGAIVLYSRNNIRRVEALADLIPVLGSSLRQNVDGVLSGSYVKHGKYKDLQVIQHPNSIILDDRPEYILREQWAQVIPIKRFKPDLVILDQGLIAAGGLVHPSWVAGVIHDEHKLNLSPSSPSVSDFTAHHKKLMENVIRMIESAHAKSYRDKVSFLEAIAPNSYQANLKAK